MTASSSWATLTEYSLSKHLRDRIWATYRPGQEITKDPSKEYMAAAMAVQTWIRQNGAMR